MRKDRYVLTFLISIFFVFTFFLAFRIRMGVSPDSYYHFEVSQAYSTTLGIPENTTDTFKWRDITRIPYLYFWINGRLLNINNGYFNEVILLRIVNVIYSTLTVYFIYLLAKEILKGKWIRLLPVFLLTNTLMFVFLSSSINYDNLTNLFSVIGIYFFVKFVKSNLYIKYFLYMLLFLSLGGLTKFTILPLAFILVVLSFWEMYLKRGSLKEIKLKGEYLLLIPIFFTFFLNIQLYGINIFKYGLLEPKCDQILTHEQCLQNGVYYRDNINIPGIQIEGISHIFSLIINGERIDPIRYFGYWIQDITGKIFGIMGDSSLYMQDVFKVAYLSLLLVGIVLGLKYREKFPKVDKYLFLTAIFYIAILFFVQNYNMYLKRDYLYLALQGRYIFPVISILFILFSKVLSFLRKNWFRCFLLLTVIVLFFYGTIPFFFLNVQDWWFDINF
jgi:hypothetical protein